VCFERKLIRTNVIDELTKHSNTTCKSSTFTLLLSALSHKSHSNCDTSLVVSLVMPRLDYGNATLAGLPAYQHQRLQSVLNAAARLVHRSSKYDHITPILRDLHWLKSPDCTCRTTSSASRTRIVVVSGRHRHHFWLSDEQDSVPSATVPSQ